MVLYSLLCCLFWTVTLVVVLAPVSELVYLSTFFSLFLIGLVLEVLVLHRRYASGTGETP